MNGQRQEIEFRIVFPDNRIKWIRAHHLTIAEADDKHVLTGMAEDFTPQKDSYDTLEKFAAKKNTVLEILSHDLAGPLNNIKGLSGLLVNSLKQYENPEVD